VNYKWHYNPATEFGEIVWLDGVSAVFEGYRAKTFDALSEEEKAAFSKGEYDAEVERRMRARQNRGR